MSFSLVPLKIRCVGVMVKYPPVGIVWQLGKRRASSGPIPVNSSVSDVITQKFLSIQAPSDIASLYWRVKSSK
ncbi:hypothetical protein TNCV_2095381 [Trichonephila clavipes]|nr:hypothetical protein TNCV_2095381 [Trichonephila clavipes]